MPSPQAIVEAPPVETPRSPPEGPREPHTPASQPGREVHEMKQILAAIYNDMQALRGQQRKQGLDIQALRGQQRKKGWDIQEHIRRDVKVEAQNADMEDVLQRIYKQSGEIEALRCLHTREIGRFVHELGDLRAMQGAFAEVQDALQLQHSVMKESLDELQGQQALSAQALAKIHMRQDWTSENMHYQHGCEIKAVLRDVKAEMARLRDDLQCCPEVHKGTLLHSEYRHPGPRSELAKRGAQPRGGGEPERAEAGGGPCPHSPRSPRSPRSPSPRSRRGPGEEPPAWCGAPRSPCGSELVSPGSPLPAVPQAEASLLLAGRTPEYYNVVHAEEAEAEMTPQACLTPSGDEPSVEVPRASWCTHFPAAMASERYHA